MAEQKTYTDSIELRGEKQYERALVIYRQKTDQKTTEFFDNPHSKHRWFAYPETQDWLHHWILYGQLPGRKLWFTIRVRYFTCVTCGVGEQCKGHDRAPFVSGYTKAHTGLVQTSQEQNIRSVSLFFDGYMIERLYKTHRDTDWIKLW